MTRQEKIEAVKAFHDRLRAEQEKGSTGVKGKLIDYVVRDFVMAHGVETEADIRCRPASKTDWTIRINGKTYHGETKTAAGGWKVTEPGIRAEDIYPKADFIAYAAEVDNVTEDNVPDMIFLLTRKQFIELLTVTGRKGLDSSLKYNQKRGTVEIQQWSVFNKKTQKWVSARLDKYYDYLEANEIPTLRDWVNAVRG